MRARKSHLAIIVGYAFVLLAIAILGPVAVTLAATSDGDTLEQPVDQNVGFCGDGVCNLGYGEDTQTCPQDCMTPTAASTITATVSQPIVIRRTEEPTASPPPPTATNTPVPPIIVPDATDTPTPVLPSEGLTIADFFPGLVNEACSPITFGDFPQSTKDEYYDIAVREYQAPDDLEVINCTGQLGTTTICFPIREATGLVEAAEGFYSRISMLNCTADGCDIVPRQGTRVGDRVCYDILEEDEVSCLVGCVLAPLAQDVPTGPQQSGINRGIIIGSVVAVIIVIGVAAFLLISGGLFGAASDDDDDEEET